MTVRSNEIDINLAILIAKAAQLGMRRIKILVLTNRDDVTSSVKTGRAEINFVKDQFVPDGHVFTLITYHEVPNPYYIPREALPFAAFLPDEAAEEPYIWEPLVYTEYGPAQFSQINHSNETTFTIGMDYRMNARIPDLISKLTNIKWEEVHE